MARNGIWAKPPTNLGGDTNKPHYDPGSVVCPNCKKPNSVSPEDRKKGKINCTRCGKEIKVA